MVVTVAITTAGTAAAEGMRTQRTRASGTPRGPGGPGELPGALLSRRQLYGAGTGLIPQLVLALVCAGYAFGSALGWGSAGLALFMGDFGLSAAAGTAAVSCFLYARSRRSRFRPAWLLFALSSTMASLGNGVWGGTRSSSTARSRVPATPISSSSVSLRPPS